MAETFYEVLEVPRDASQAAIRAAYREKVKEAHPDVSDREDATERFKRIKRAESVLGDPEERARYDRLGHEAYVGDGEERNEADDAADSDPDERSEDSWEDVRAAAERAQRTTGGADAGGRSAGWRERERRRAEWARTVGRNAEHRGFGERRASWGAGEGSTDRGATRGGGRKTATGAGPEADWTAWDATENADGTSAGTASGRDRAGYAARETPDGSRGRSLVPDWGSDDVMLVFSSFVFYPILLWSVVLSPFPVAANAAFAVVALATAGFLLTRPTVALAVFGGWSLLFPVLLVGFGVPLASLETLVFLGGSWVPLLYAATAATLLR